MSILSWHTLTRLISHTVIEDKAIDCTLTQPKNNCYCWHSKYRQAVSIKWKLQNYVDSTTKYHRIYCSVRNKSITTKPSLASPTMSSNNSTTTPQTNSTYYLIDHSLNHHNFQRFIIQNMPFNPNTILVELQNNRIIK